MAKPATLSKAREYPELGDNFKGPFSPLEVARYIVNLPPSKEVPAIGLVKLNKLTFIAHGWLLGKHQRPLVKEEASVWQGGPVYEGLHAMLTPLCKKGRVPERKQVAEALGADGRASGAISSCAEAIHLDHICARYGGYDARTLIDLTFREESPWFMAFAGGYDTISDKVVACYYQQILR